MKACEDEAGGNAVEEGWSNTRSLVQVFEVLEVDGLAMIRRDLWVGTLTASMRPGLRGVSG